MIVTTCDAAKSMWSVQNVLAMSRLVSVWEVCLVLAAVEAVVEVYKVAGGG